MKLVLIGFMASGKSSCAKFLAEELSYKLIELDDLILEQSGRGSISEIFEKDGEKHFRALESEVIATLGEIDDVVISCGGGVVEDSANVVKLKGNGGVIVYLEIDFETAVARDQGESRPLLKNIEAAREVYKSRLPLYQRTADFVVDAQKQKVDGVCRKILEFVWKAKNINTGERGARGE